MINIYSFIKNIYFQDRGASVTEYGLLIAGVAFALIFVFSLITGAFNDGFQFIIDSISNAVNQ